VKLFGVHEIGNLIFWLPSYIAPWTSDLCRNFQPHYGPGVESAPNRNEYQEHFFGVKAAGALLNLNRGARRAWVVSTTPPPLHIRERPGTHCTGGWVGPRAGLDVCEKYTPLPAGIRSRDRPVVSRYTDWATRPTMYFKYFQLPIFLSITRALSIHQKFKIRKKMNMRGILVEYFPVKKNARVIYTKGLNS
jgi:hypothetical protein